MRALLLICLVMMAALPAGAAADLPPTGCDAVEPLPVRFHGVIDAAGPARWRVAGQWVDVTSATIVRPAGHPPAPGEWAQVAALWRLDGALTAMAIDVSPAPPAGGQPVRFTGLVEAIDPQAWTIGGTRVWLTPDTVVVGAGAVGSVALVVAEQAGAGLTALLLAAAPPGVDPVFLAGVLLAAGPGEWQVQANGGGVTVALDGDTFVQGDPVVGRNVEVMAVERPGQPLHALYASVAPAGDQRISFGGRLANRITATAPEQWLLLTPSDDGPWLELRTVMVDRLSTPIDETGGPATPGAWLDVAAIPPTWPAEPWIARSLRVDLGPQTTVQGALSEIREGAPARWQVGDVCIIVDSAAAVDGRARLDRYVIAQGVRLGSVAVWARSAAIRYRFHGVLSARLSHVTPPTWVVLVFSRSHVDASTPTRVYLALDATSRVDPALQTGVLGVQVAVQARAGSGGWLVDWIDDPASPWQP